MACTFFDAHEILTFDVVVFFAIFMVRKNHPKFMNAFKIRIGTILNNRKRNKFDELYKMTLILIKMHKFDAFKWEKHFLFILTNTNIR